MRKISGFILLFPLIIAVLTVWLFFDKMPLPVQVIIQYLEPLGSWSSNAPNFSQNLVERLVGSLSGNTVQKAATYNAGEWEDPNNSKKRAKKRASN